jgi:uncharacterized protein (TIGR03086 family)
VTTYDVMTAAEARLTALVESLDPSALDRPTPCDGWDVRALLSHTLVGIEVFAAAIDGGAAPSADDMFGGADLLGDDPVAATKRATTRSQTAWRDLAHPERPVETVLGPLPAGQAMAISAFATAVHTWDLAIATGQPITELPADQLAHADAIAHQIVPELRGTQGHGLFQPELPAQPDATATQRLMAFLGRTSS